MLQVGKSQGKLKIVKASHRRSERSFFYDSPKARMDCTPTFGKDSIKFSDSIQADSVSHWVKTVEPSERIRLDS
jgi:hypothetical protein